MIQYSNGLLLTAAMFQVATASLLGCWALSVNELILLSLIEWEVSWEVKGFPVRRSANRMTRMTIVNAEEERLCFARTATNFVALLFLDL